MAYNVVHFEIMARDAAKAREFYGGLFEWDIQYIPEMGYALVPAPESGQGIGGGIGEAEDPSGQMVTFYVEVPDVQEHLDRAVAMGATVVQPVTVIPDMVTSAVFADPEGNRIGLVKSDQQ